MIKSIFSKNDNVSDGCDFAGFGDLKYFQNRRVFCLTILSVMCGGEKL